MDTKKPTYHDLLIELINLKRQDYGKFMEKLYEAITGEYVDVLKDSEPIGEKQKAMAAMIQYFQEKEEYEKCAKLKQLADTLIP